MKNIITTYINNCGICLQTKYDRHPLKIEYEITETPKRPMEILHIDFCFFQNHVFLTVLDKFTKFAAAFYMKTRTSKEVQRRLIQFFSTHGKPSKIVSDNEGNMNTPSFKAFLQEYDIQLHHTSSYSSTGNSPVERLHSTLQELMKIAHIKTPQENIKNLMHHCILSYNNTIHTATKFTPFELLSGHHTILGRSIDPAFSNAQDYLFSHTLNYDELCKRIHEETHAKKTKLINKLNVDRVKPPSLKLNQTIHVRNKKRSKIKPGFVIRKVLRDNKVTVLTKDGKYHKKLIKKPFQVHSNHGSNPQSDQPGDQQRLDTDQARSGPSNQQL
jgi:hypothetical protein